LPDHSAIEAGEQQRTRAGEPERRGFLGSQRGLFPLFLRKIDPILAKLSRALGEAALAAPEVVAAEAPVLRDEGGFTALKLRLGRDRASDDLAAIHAIRAAVGDDMELMVDFNQGLHLGEALQRCHMIDDEGLAWIEEPIVYDNLDGYVQLTAELNTPIQIGENFYGPPRSTHRSAEKGVRPRPCPLTRFRRCADF
jgi:L-alanine-DL-glutamate epimerase-like enolase superfamily enzyme